MILGPSCKQEDNQIRSSISLRWGWELQLTSNSPCQALNFILAKEKKLIKHLRLLKVKLLKQEIIQLPLDKNFLPSDDNIMSATD